MNPKDEAGRNKVQLGLVPPVAVAQCARAFEDGARKYGAYNWRGQPVNYMVYIHAALRHIQALIDGENVAPDSQVHHAAHAMASLAIILDAEACKKINDDRPIAREHMKPPMDLDLATYREIRDKMRQIL